MSKSIFITLITIMASMVNEGEKELIDVTHVSAKGTSSRITLPKRVSSMLNVKDGSIIAFYRKDGEILIELLK